MVSHRDGAVVGTTDHGSITALGGASPSSSTASRRQVSPPHPCIRMHMRTLRCLVHMLTRAVVAVLAQELASPPLVDFICTAGVLSGLAAG